jgi:hypothetical protein
MAGMLKARVPTQWNGNGAPITKVNGQGVGSRVDIHGIRDFDFKGQITYSMPP